MHPFDDEPTGRGSASTRGRVWALLLFAVAALVSTFPLEVSLLDHIPAGRDPGLALRSFWAESWIGHQLVRQPQNLLDANAYHPTPGSLALADLLIPEALLALPVTALTSNPVLGYNVAYLAVLLLSGLGVYLLAGELGCGRTAALVAGLVVAAAPYRAQAAGRPELLAAAWPALCLWCLLSFFRRRRTMAAVGAGAFLAASFLSSLWNGAQTLIAFCVVALVCLLRWRTFAHLRVWAGLIGALLVFAFIASPFVPARIKSVASARQLPLQAEGLDPGKSCYRCAPEGNLVYNRLLRFKPQAGIFAFPGLAATVCGILGLVFSLTGVLKARRRQALCFGLLALVAFAGTLAVSGPGTGFLYRFIAPGAFVILLSVSVAILAGLFVERLGAGHPGPRTALVPALLGIVIVIEGLALPAPLQKVQPLDEGLAAVLSTVPPNLVLADLPVLGGGPINAHYLAASVAHFRPMVNGYGTHAPAGYADFLDAVDAFPDLRSLQALMERNVGVVVLHADRYPVEERLAVLDRLARLRPYLSEQAASGDTKVYALNSSAQAVARIRSQIKNEPLPAMPPTGGRPCFEIGEKLEYEAKLMGFLAAGSATIEVLPAQDREEILLKLAGKPSRMARQFFDGEALAEALVSAADLLPSWGAFEMRQPSGTWKTTVRFIRRQRTTQAILDDKYGRPVPLDTMTALSMLYRLRCITLRKGERFAAPVIEKGILYNMEGTVRGTDTLTTAAGTFQCRAYSLNAGAGSGSDLEGTVSVWISQTGPRVPVRMEVPMKIGALRLDLIRIGGS